jgi:nicotinate dehydrogenase subunit B
LNGNSTAPEPWTEPQLYAYLRTGVEARHGAAAGPMIPVIAELAEVPDKDLHAMATYLASLMPGAPPAPPQVAGHPSAMAAALFAGACATCHGSDATAPLALGTSLAAPQPTDAARILLAGLQPPSGRSGAFMPGFADALTDEQMADLLVYLREEVAGRPGWTDVAAALRQARQE